MNSASFTSSRKSDRNYFEWRKYRAFQAIELVEKYRNLSSLKILDVGCGYGALLAALSEKGAIPTGIENDKEVIVSAKKFIGGNINIIRGNSEKLPFGNEEFDVIFLLDVIEHVKNPYKSIEECKRVLKPDGILYIEFTPYYSLVGHHLYDIVKWPIHILPRSFIRWFIYKKIEDTDMAVYYWKAFKSLNKIKISKVQVLLRLYKKMEERFIIKYPGFFEIRLPFTNLVSPIKDLFTFSYIGIFLKPKQI